MEIDDPVEKVPLIGPLKAALLRNLNIFSVSDLLHHYPFRYQDYSRIFKISELVFGQTGTVLGAIEKIDNIFTRNRSRLTKARLVDETGSIELIWFNQPFLSKTLKPGTKVAVSGTVGESSGKLAFVSPDYEIRSRPGSGNLHTARLVPIYPETAGISSKWLRSRLGYLLTTLPEIPEILPSGIVQSERLMSLDEALHKIHFPVSFPETLEAKNRLSFDELFFKQLEAKLNRETWEENGPHFKFSIINFLKKVDEFISSLPFELTNDQKKVTKIIIDDLSKSKPMNRLVQGDVGSGKTVVAAIAAYATVLSKFKVLIMCPTEILANQHFETFKKLFSKFDIATQLVTSSTRPPAKSEMINNPACAGKKSQIIIGTHALLYNLKNLSDVGFVVIDEQHKFGVEQRTKLLELFKTDHKLPHLLSMTATPIPRTLALTSLGDLDISYIEELPKGRRQIKTWVVPQSKRGAAYEWVEKQIMISGGQVYVVCPFIEESENESLKSVRAAKKEFDSLQKVFSPLKVELLHGKMRPREKEETMKKFATGETKILVTTPVVEVGVDNPNATIILIEGAQRFGLASLHQLRGRVGRSNKESYCLLFTSDDSSNLSRLKLLEKTNSGLKLAEFDLRNRGTGQIYGREQSGYFKTKIADLSDFKFLTRVSQSVSDFLTKNRPFLKNPLLLNRLGQQTRPHPD